MRFLCLATALLALGCGPGATQPGSPIGISPVLDQDGWDVANYRAGLAMPEMDLRRCFTTLQGEARMFEFMRDQYYQIYLWGRDYFMNESLAVDDKLDALVAEMYRRNCLFPGADEIEVRLRHGEVFRQVYLAGFQS